MKRVMTDAPASSARTAAWRLWLAAVLFGLIGGTALGADPHLDVMYQRVQQVVIKHRDQWQEFLLRQVLRIDPANLDLVRMVTSQAEMRVFPQPGERWVRSIGHPQMAYQVKRVRVRSREDLHRAMTGGAGPLTAGQSALMTLYETLTADAVTRLRRFAYRDKVQVMLTDLSVIEERSMIDETTHQGRPLRAIISLDFWPMAVGVIQFSSIYFVQPGRAADGSPSYSLCAPAFIRSNAVHEYAHTLDRMLPTVRLPVRDMLFTGFVIDSLLSLQERGSCYGRDQAHYLNEPLTPLAASLEGWAVFHEMINDAEVAAHVRRTMDRIAFERPEPFTATFEGNYDVVGYDDPRVTGQTILCTEGAQALILYRLAREGAPGWEGVCQAFVLANRPFRRLRDLLRAYLHLHPEQAGLAIRTVDEETRGKLTVPELVEIFGDAPELRTLLINRGIPGPAFCPVSASEAATPVDPRAAVQTDLGDLLELPTE